MDSNTEATQSTSTSLLQMERAVLVECLRAYDELITTGAGDSETLAQGPAVTQRADTIARLENLTTILNEASGRITVLPNKVRPDPFGLC